MTANEYREMLTRWLKVKRDMPWNSEPEPGWSHEFDWHSLVRDWMREVRREVMNDFNRT